MEYTTLGSTGLDVSRLCLGCLNMGSGTRPDENWTWTKDDPEKSRELIAEALDAGINFLDTANMYSLGESEELVGEVISGYDRDELVVATKVGRPMGTGPNTTGLSRKHVIDQAYASLERLDIEYIDLYQIHCWDDKTPIEQTLSALTYLVDEGIVRYVGASTMSAWKLLKASSVAERDGFEQFVSVQPEYSLVRRHEEANLLPAAADQGLGVITWSPLASGFLAGKYSRDGADDPTAQRLEDPTHPAGPVREQDWQVLDVVRDLADRYDATPAQISIAWLLEQDVVDAPIIGPRTLDQLADCLGALDVSLTDDDIDRLEASIRPTWPPIDH